MKFKTFRESQNMTQDELALKLNISRSSIAMWESGKSLPRTELLIKLADIFGCTIDELVRGDERE